MPNRGRRLLAPIAVWEGAGAEHVEGGLPPLLPVLALQCEAVLRAKYGVVQYHFHALEVHAWAVYLRACEQPERWMRWGAIAGRGAERNISASCVSCEGWMSPFKGLFAARFAARSPCCPSPVVEAVTVLSVAHDGPADACKVAADLVVVPSLRRDLDQRVSVVNRHVWDGTDDFGYL